MYFDSLSAALHMDGHGVFVWSAYLISMSVVAFMLAAPRVRERKLIKNLAAQQRRLAGQSDTLKPVIPE
ncbi:MAG: heme exporter protein CcmD [Halieaceae bacterium]